MKDHMLYQTAPAANTPDTKDGDPLPGDCCTVPGGGDPGPGGPGGPTG